MYIQTFGLRLFLGEYNNGTGIGKEISPDFVKKWSSNRSAVLPLRFFDMMRPEDLLKRIELNAKQRGVEHIYSDGHFKMDTVNNVLKLIGFNPPDWIDNKGNVLENIPPILCESVSFMNSILENLL